MTDTAPTTGRHACEEGTRERKKLQTRQAIHDASLSLVRERGLGGVTIEEICQSADVSPRTFFNYYPTKAAAVLGLRAPEVDPLVAEQFHAANGDLIADIVELMARTMPRGQQDVRDLIRDRPEIAPAMHAWLAELRENILQAVASRTDAETARLAVAFVTAALTESIRSSEVNDHDEVVAAVRDNITRMAALVHA